jgi:hypothetical protein
MDDGYEWWFIDADEQYIVAVLSKRDCSHVSALEAVTRPQLRRQLPLQP